MACKDKTYRITRAQKKDPRKGPGRKKGEKMSIWKVYSLDTWGNAEDGYEENNSYPRGTVEIGEDESAEAFTAALRDAEVLMRDTPDDYYEDGGDFGPDMVYLEHDGKPEIKLIRYKKIMRFYKIAGTWRAKKDNYEVVLMPRTPNSLYEVYIYEKGIGSYTDKIKLISGNDKKAKRDAAAHFESWRNK